MYEKEQSLEGHRKNETVLMDLPKFGVRADSLHFGGKVAEEGDGSQCSEDEEHREDTRFGMEVGEEFT